MDTIGTIAYRASRRSRLMPSDQPIPVTDPLWILPIAGTEGWGDTWWQDGSEWLEHLANANVRALRRDTLRGPQPFRWSTDLDGLDPFRALLNVVRGFFNRHKLAAVHRDWQAGGESCAGFLTDVPYERRNLIAHSHGGQVGIYAALDREIRTLVTIGTPVRGDMQEVYEQARPHIGYHLHICDDTWDLWGTLGQLFDGDVTIHRTFPKSWAVGPDLTITLPGIGHAKVLRDPQELRKWTASGWVDLLRLGQYAARFHAAFGETRG